MNFLQLVNRLRLEAGVSGADLSTVINQTGEMARLVKWINAAWMDIQSMREDWPWMRTSCSFATVAGQATYTVAQCGVTDLGAWARDTFRNYDTAEGINSEIFMEYVAYEKWRDLYLFGSLRSNQSRPIEITITPDLSLGLGPVPAAGYTAIGDYYRIPSEMALDDDIPGMPNQHHLAIVYRAMMSYGAYEAAPEVYQRGETEFKTIMRRLSNSRLPEITLGGALA